MKPPGPFKSVERFRLFEEPPREEEVFASREAFKAPGGFLAFASTRRLMMAHMAPAQLLWEVAREHELAPEDHPRPISAWQSSCLIDASGGRVFEVCERAGDAVVEARELITGNLLWSAEIPSPQPASWAEPEPAWPGAQTEAIDAFLALVPDGLAIMLNRTSRRTMYSDANVEVMWLPPFESQVDIRVVDALSGRPLRSFTLPNVAVGVLERDRFTGLHQRGRYLCDVDWTRGEAQVVAEAPGAVGVPRRVGTHIVAPWQIGAEIGVIAVGPAGNIASSGWKRKGVRDVAIFDAGAEPLLHVNAQTLVMLNDDLTPRWEARAKPWVYQVAAFQKQPVFVGTAGGGGRLYEFDRDTGQEFLNQKPVHQGCPDLQIVDGAEWLVTSFNTTRRYGFGIALVRPDGSEFQTVNVPGLVATWNGRMATSLDYDGMMSVYTL